MMTKPRVHKEALESVLQVLDNLMSSPDGPAVAVCIQCWSVFDEGTCTCETPLWWPLQYAVSKLRSLAYRQA